jgi:hypothetical protein
MTGAVRVTIHVWMSHHAAVTSAVTLGHSIGQAFHMPVQRLVVPTAAEQVYIIDLHGWSEPLQDASVAVCKVVDRFIEAMLVRAGTEVTRVDAVRT